MAPVPVCTDSRTTQAPARAPTARTPATAPTATANTTTSAFVNCTRGTIGTLSGADLATCLGYLAYGLQTPAAQQSADPSSRLAQCYTALSDGDDFTTNQARTCVNELRTLFNATIGRSTSAASSFCSSSSNCATCAFCQASTNVRCSSDCTLVDDFPDVSIDGSTYTIYSDEEESDVAPPSTGTPSTGSSSSGSIITADRDTVNAVNALLGQLGTTDSLGSFGRKLLRHRDLLAIRPLGGASTSSSSDLGSLPAGAYVITSVVTSTLRCTEGACLDLLK